MYVWAWGLNTVLYSIRNYGDLVLFKLRHGITALQYLGNTVAACHLRCRLVMIGAQAEGDGVGFEVQYWCYWYQVLVLI